MNHKPNYEIPTPEKCAEFMVKLLPQDFDLLNTRILENSCGAGNILSALLKKILTEAAAAHISAPELSRRLKANILAYEVNEAEIDNCRTTLNDLLKGPGSLCSGGSDGLSGDTGGIEQIDWQLHHRDYLTSSPHSCNLIIGNPPYQTYHQIPLEERPRLRADFVSCRSGRFDYYYAFIEKSLNDLAPGGHLIYLVPHGLLKNRSAGTLRELLLPHLLAVHDLAELKIFPDSVLINCVIIHACKDTAQTTVNLYRGWQKTPYLSLEKTELGRIWSFEQTSQHQSGLRLGDYFEIRNAPATLCNEVFLLTDYQQDGDYILKDGHRLELSLMRPAVSPRLLSSVKKDSPRPLIIFPYKTGTDGLTHFTETELKDGYPGIFAYLSAHRKKLEARRGQLQGQWFEYGRDQGLSSLAGPKLLLPKIISAHLKTHLVDETAVPFAGFYVRTLMPTAYSLEDAARIFASPEFLSYARSHGTPTAKDSYCLSLREMNDFNFRI